ncbi:MAG: hydroxyacid dehydrogenase [Bacteroidia bacterium]|nr:hydroxyacid dehydrogenase [Bacteroidia bacterium]
MNILFLDTAHPFLIDSLRKDGHNCIEDYAGAAYLKRGNEEIHGIVIRSRVRIGKETIDLFSSLKFIARVGAGMENIDVIYAESKGIRCLHAPEGNRTAVAEHVIGMLLMLINNLKKADREVREGKWIREGNRGWELEGKTIGIIGGGNMGSALAERLVSFNCRILVHDKYLKPDTGNDNAPSLQLCSLQEIFHHADIVSLHLPLTEETQYYADDRFFDSFRKKIIFINTARGKNLLTSALVRALRSGKVSGACLDVLEYESGSFENLSGLQNDDLRFLMSSENTILTPHIAGWTIESNLKMAEILFRKISALK